jgi:hypothetical protein
MRVQFFYAVFIALLFVSSAQAGPSITLHGAADASDDDLGTIRRRDEERMEMYRRNNPGGGGVKNIRKDGDKTYVECNNGRLLYVQPADSSRYGIGKCWGNATYSPTNCGELMNKTIEWCSL